MTDVHDEQDVSDEPVEPVEPLDPVDPDPVDADPVERRARFRVALEAVSDASSKDLMRWVMIPAAVAVIVGFNLMILGWIGAARTAREIEQIPYLISGGLIGLGLVVLGSLLLATLLWAVVVGRMQREAEERHRDAIAAIARNVPPETD